MIELLAVIILIGVIALIVSPIIIGTIKKSKKATFERSIDGIIDSVRIDYSGDKFIAPREYYYDRTNLTLLTVNDKTRDEEVKISGKIDGNGFIYVDEEGNIYIENICNKEYCASGPEGDLDISDNETGEVPELNKKDPMIKLNGDNIIYVELNGTYKELGAVARTKVGEPLEYQIEIKQSNNVVPNIDTSKEGEYIVTYRATSNDKTVTVERKVIVLEMTPVITMTEPNSSYVKEQEVLINVSGKLPNKISQFTYQINDGEVQTVNGTTKTLVLNTTGIQTIKVTVEDDHNHKSTLSRSYKIDTIPPVITFEESTTVKVTEVATFNLLTGVRVEDNIDGVIDSSRIMVSGSLSSTLGNQTITYTVSDTAGNVTSKTRTITIVEAEGPILNFSSISSNNKWVKAQEITVTATDNSNLYSFTYEVFKNNVSQGVQTVNVSGKSASTNVSLSADGTYSIKLTGRDQYGNSSTSSSGTYKIDVTKPTITMSNVTIKDSEVESYNLMTGVTVNDNSGVTPTVKTTGTLGTTPKDYTITYTVTDEAGNVTTATRTITVQVSNVDITGANKPDLTNGLVPIKWNGSNWIKADESNPSGEYQWYDYGTQMWANAASVTSSYRNVSVGTTIPESAVLAYFVWIPRYEYQYTNLGESYAGGTKELPGEIKINFIETSKTIPSSDDYKEHPAFTFGAKQLSGIWVGKFETTGNATTPTIKPNLSSLRSQNVSEQFATSQKFSASGNTYGISEPADAHMMKNSEWGAVAYLSQSKYGKYGNTSYTGANKEIYVNNNRRYITGCSGGAPHADGSANCDYTYEKGLNGIGASTSGTIYGIYDMSGGASENVMCVYKEMKGDSGFESLPDSKYYDNYTTTTVSTACLGNICYGHALSETGGWYSDMESFLSSGIPWLTRGGDSWNSSTRAGAFHRYQTSGSDVSSSASFRVVLAG